MTTLSQLLNWKTVTSWLVKRVKKANAVKANVVVIKLKRAKKALAARRAKKVLAVRKARKALAARRVRRVRRVKKALVAKRVKKALVVVIKTRVKKDLVAETPELLTYESP